MLTIWRRHREKCPHKADRYYRKCRCACHVEGTVEGIYRRHSLKTRSWERAIELVREIEDGKAPEPDKKSATSDAVTIQNAIEVFTADLNAQNRAGDTIRKYRLLFDALKKLGTDRPITDFTFDVLVKFRASWSGLCPASANKQLDRLKAFFRFAHDAGWIAKNPTKAIKPAKARAKMVQPFSSEEQTTILSKPQTRQIRCFVRVLFYSALRISDVCMLKPSDFDGNSIRRKNIKNGQTVYIPVPPDLKAELDKLSLNGGYYFLKGQSEKHYTQSDAWRSLLNSMFKETMPGFHAHRFRHTAAVNWLASGLTMEEVAGLLGNSVRVVERHYASFAPSRQQVISEKLERIWSAKPKLVRVK